MVWTRQIELTQEVVLDRIVALLFAIADLAELAAFAPEARRRLALAFIRSAEAVARDAFCVPAKHPADGQESCAAIFAPAGDGPEEALALAVSLRALALIVGAIAARKRRLSRLTTAEFGYGSSGRRPHHPRHHAARGLPGTALRPVERLDTS
ncbi:MAG: hypothetical protein Q8Q62_08880 [Mesorhizobium sp.]|nr:hypothetical protein [Mesorhizobium sp.]